MCVSVCVWMSSLYRNAGGSCVLKQGKAVSGKGGFQKASMTHSLREKGREKNMIMIRQGANSRGSDFILHDGK